uniref:NADH dehydrogenase [ubiquinone] 1 alpha subcomplex subunit 11 n=1 Tax=Amphiprion percula TaxID=161767 RepID=A0A3P8U2A2_AMPPE
MKFRFVLFFFPVLLSSASYSISAGGESALYARLVDGEPRRKFHARIPFVSLLSAKWVTGMYQRAQTAWKKHGSRPNWELLWAWLVQPIILQRATSATVTMATMGAIFGMTTCLTAQAREAPDDPLNYFVGGCASGIFLGARTHSAITGTSACLGLGTLAFFTKVGKMEGWKLAGPPKL